ncbi:hypothetical protein [Flavobacterium caeni]|uniref:Uncharacterized protein n=1 Tax=Flavobacterium caeni TaxID=490189 RepID=A0A1G5K535_9FLAO|nr:hypothetical protein [Flavobacterium caeni]SCY95677.1 hypothetical protein SAMN02927903_03091 [Flavobacterium caeni]
METHDLKQSNRNKILWIAVLIVLNTLLYTMAMKGRTLPERLTTALAANLIGYNVIGLLLGTVVALFPYKNLGYAKKYLRASLLVILTLQIVMTVGLLLVLLMTFAGWY